MRWKENRGTGMRRKLWLAVAAGAVILGIVWLRDRAVYSFQLHGVSDAIYGAGCLYFIDNGGDVSNLFKTDMGGRVQGRIDAPKLQGAWWNSFSSLVRDRDGQVYVYCYSRAMDRAVGRSLVYRCDFEQGSLEFAWELPSVKMLQVQVIDGQVYYLGEEAEGGYGLYSMDRQGRKTLVRRVEGASSSVKDACYDPEKGIAWADWNGRFYYNGREAAPEGPRDPANIRIDRGGVYYLDAEDHVVKNIPFDSREAVPLFRAEDAALLSPGLAYEDVLPFHYYEDGTWLGGVDISHGRRVLGIFDREGTQRLQVASVRLRAEDRGAMWLQTVCICLVCGAVLAGGVRLGLRRTGGTVPIIAKLLLILIPLILSVSFLLNRQLRISLEKRMLGMDYELLYVIADLKLSVINSDHLMKMDLQRIPDDPYYRDIFMGEDYSVLPQGIYQYGSAKPQPVIANVYHWIFLQKDGIMRYGQVDGRHYFGGRVAFDRSIEEMEKMDMAMRNQVAVKTEYNDFTGDFIALYIPVVNGSGQSVGVMESGVNRRILTYGVNQQMAQVHVMIAAVMALLIGILVSVLAFFLYPLGRLREAVEDVGRGNLGRKVRARGRDEVADISHTFNRMSETLKTQVDFIQACMAGYAAFVPSKVLEILEREDITRVRLGDQKEIEAAVLNIGSRQLKEEAGSLSGDGLYRIINQMLSEMIPVIAGDEGVVDHMRGDGVEAYYPYNCQGALRSAAAIRERIRSMREEGSHIPACRCGLGYGLMKLGIVGGRERMEASSISELKSLAEFLTSMAETYGAGIILLESAAGRIGDFRQRYHVREIGTLYCRRTGEAEKIYDVYDGDEAADFRAKERTKEWFCKAMEAYRNKKYYDARLAFAKVLKENGSDLAARAYVYRCDAFYRTGDENAVPPHLEEY